MTVMTSEFSHPPTMAVPRSQREDFKNTKRPPAGWYIFIGRYTGLQWDTRFRHRGAKSSKPGPGVKRPETNNSHSTLFVVGHFMVFVIGSLEIDFINRPEEFVQFLSKTFNLAPIFPFRYGNISWRELGMNYDIDADELADQLRSLPMSGGN